MARCVWPTWLGTSNDNLSVTGSNLRSGNTFTGIIYFNTIRERGGCRFLFHQGGGFFCSSLLSEILFVTVAVFCELVVAALTERVLIHYHGSTRCASIESGFGLRLRHHLTISYSRIPRKGYICVRCASCIAQHHETKHRKSLCKDPASSSRRRATATTSTPPLGLMRMLRSSPSKSNTTKRTLQIRSVFTFKPFPLMSGEITLVGEGAAITA